mmetsp:Transcript_32433/g.89686  ORF Transcript_32433/g.89686 Transcript_32433/m.89686 type:complete len:302 (-) Transcript_32433:1092-1997(-)
MPQPSPALSRRSSSNSATARCRPKSPTPINVAHCTIWLISSSRDNAALPPSRRAEAKSTAWAKDAPTLALSAPQAAPATFPTSEPKASASAAASPQPPFWWRAFLWLRSSSSISRHSGGVRGHSLSRSASASTCAAAGVSGEGLTMRRFATPRATRVPGVADSVSLCWLLANSTVVPPLTGTLVSATRPITLAATPLGRQGLRGADGKRRSEGHKRGAGASTLARSLKNAARSAPHAVARPDGSRRSKLPSKSAPSTPRMRVHCSAASHTSGRFCNAHRSARSSHTEPSQDRAAAMRSTGV